MSRLILLLGLAAVLSACKTAEAPLPPPVSFAYSFVWGGEPPEPYYSQAVRLYEAGAVQVLRVPLERVEAACGRNRSPSGWFGAACMMTGNATGTQFVVIASEITDPVAIRNIMIHEIAHTRPGGDWPADHPGGLKPRNHLDNCIRDMNALGLTVAQMGELCYLNGGAPLRTAEERARWEAMR